MPATSHYFVFSYGLPRSDRPRRGRSGYVAGGPAVLAGDADCPGPPAQLVSANS